MALTVFHNFVLTYLMDQGITDSDSLNSILEIGEQNWYYPNVNSTLMPILQQRGANDPNFEEWVKQLNRCEQSNGQEVNLFDVAQIYYEAMFGDFKYMAIDMHGTSRSTVADLNNPFEHDDQFDLVTNLGTSEHVFNQAQVFKTIHNLTKQGGLMYHGLSHQGQYDHGFYNYQPTFFADLASANSYKIELMAINSSGGNMEITILEKYEHYHDMVANNKVPVQAGLHVVLRKTTNEEFIAPQQGYYSENPDAEVMQFWRSHSTGHGKS